MRNYFSNHSDKERRLIWFAESGEQKPQTDTEEPKPDEKVSSTPKPDEVADATVEKLEKATTPAEVEAAAEEAEEAARLKAIEDARIGAEKSKAELLKAGNLNFKERVDAFKNDEENQGADPTSVDKQKMVDAINRLTPDDGVDFILNAEGTALEIDQLFEDKTRKAVVDAFREIAEFIREIIAAITEGLNGAAGKGTDKTKDTKKPTTTPEGPEGPTTTPEGPEGPTTTPEGPTEGPDGLSKEAKNKPNEAIDTLNAEEVKLEAELGKLVGGEGGVTKEETGRIGEINDRLKVIHTQIEKLTEIIANRKKEVEGVWKEAMDASGIDKSNHAVTDISCEDGSTLVVTLAEGTLEGSDAVKALAAEGFKKGTGNTWTLNVPGPIFGKIKDGFQSAFNDLAKLPLKPTAKPKDDAEDGGDLDAETNKEDVEESPEKMAIALNAQLDTLRKSNSEFMSATPIGKVFTNMEYSVAADGENIMLKIDSGAAEQLRNILKTNGRDITEKDGGYVVSGYPDGSTVDMPASGKADYPSRLAWGGEAGDPKSQFAQAKEGMEVWSSMVSKEPPEDTEPIDAQENPDSALTESPESPGAQKIRTALNDIQGEVGPVKDTVYGKFINSLDVKNSKENIALTSSADAKVFASMYKQMEMGGVVDGPVEMSDGDYVMNINEDNADDFVYSMERWAAFMGTVSEGGDGDLSGDAEEGEETPEEPGEEAVDEEETDLDVGTEEADEDSEKIKADYEQALSEMTSATEDLKFHVKDETGGMDFLNDDGTVAQGSVLETRLKDVNALVLNPDLKVPDGQYLVDDLSNQLDASKLLEKFDASDATYQIALNEDGIRVERVQPDAPEETEETADETPAETPEESPEITQEQLAQLTTQVSDNLDILVEALEQGEPSPETVVDIMNEQIRDSGLDLADDSVIGAIANADPGRIGIDGVDGNTYAIAYNPGDAENPISYSAQPERRSYEEIGPLVHAQFDKITNTLLNGYENGKDILVSAIAELNALNKEAGSDYNSEIQDQSFYDEPAGTEYKLVENSDNQYELQKEKEAAA